MSFGLRGLEWPDAPAVDLLQEFPWVVADPLLEVREQQPSRKREKEERLSVSPLKQRLVRPRPERPALSPARQAANAMLELKAELQRIGSPQSRQQQPVSPPLSPLTQRKRDTTNKAFSPSKQLEAPTINVRSSPGKSRQKLPARDADLLDKQQRLMEWLAVHTSSNHSKNQDVVYSSEIAGRVHATVTPKDDIDNALWTDPVRSLLAAEITSEVVLGGFIPTRRLAFDPSKASSNSLTSPLSSNNEIATDASAINNVLTSNPSFDDESMTNITEQDTEFESFNFAIEHANDVKEHAMQQLMAGSVEDALATLQAGIHTVMYEVQSNHEELQTAGFNFSMAAHTFATKLQMKYRQRHRLRVQNVILLQRVWRKFHASSLASKTKLYEDVHARTIQRPYRCRYVRIVTTRSASRIQKCFRIYQVQKHIQHFHLAVRLLLQRERHRQELARQILIRKRRMWSKFKLVLRVLRLLKLRRDGITAIQKRWKARKYRAKYIEMLDELRKAEIERRRHEDEYVAAHIQEAADLYRRFLNTTNRGQYLLKLHAEYPWQHFRWLQCRDSVGSSRWESLSIYDKSVLLGRMYNRRRVGKMEGRVIARELLQLTINPSRHKHLRVSASGLKSLGERSVAKAGDLADLSPVLKSNGSSMQNAREHLKIFRNRINRKLGEFQQKFITKACSYAWRAWYYPKAYYWHHRICSRRSRRCAMQSLECNFRRIATGFLRSQYRADFRNAPRFECNCCYEPFATTLELHDHMQSRSATGKECGLTRTRAQLEWLTLMQVVDNIDSPVHYLSAKCLMATLAKSKHPNPTQFDDIDAIRYHKENLGWVFDAFDLANGVSQSVRDSSQEAASLCLLVEIMGALTGRASGANFEIPLNLAGFVLLGLGGFHKVETSRKCNSSKAVMIQTALGQLVQWTHAHNSHSVMSHDLMAQVIQKRSMQWRQRITHVADVIRLNAERGIRSLRDVKATELGKRGRYKPVSQEGAVSISTVMQPQTSLSTVPKQFTLAAGSVQLKRSASSAAILPV